MRKINLLFTILIIVLISENGFSQDTTSTKYYPLKYWNNWVYNFTTWDNQTGKCKILLSGMSTVNGHIYYNSVGYCMSQAPCTTPIMTNNRVDSTNGNIFKYAPGTGCSHTPNDIMLDSLRSRKGDSSLNNCNSMFKIVCTDTSAVTIFNLLRKSKTFGDVYPEGGKTRTYVYGIGLTFMRTQQLDHWCVYNLAGCVLDGVVYGDTSLTGINPISNEVPTVFSLSQNYPNPFNPTTNVQFSIPSVQYVTLKIYDILGNEVATLVNEQLKPGTYEVEFNGDNYASGVYYYTLQSESFNQTKRMVMVK